MQCLLISLLITLPWQMMKPESSGSCIRMKTVFIFFGIQTAWAFQSKLLEAFQLKLYWTFIHCKQFYRTLRLFPPWSQVKRRAENLNPKMVIAPPHSWSCSSNRCSENNKTVKSSTCGDCKKFKSCKGSTFQELWLRECVWHMSSNKYNNVIK